MNKALASLLITVLFAGNAFASGADSSTGAGRDIKSSSDKSVSTETSIDKKKSSGKKTNESWSWGGDSTAQELMKESMSAQANASADMTLPLESVFIGKVMDLEQGKGDPEITKVFQACQLISHPPLPADFGLSAEISPGVIDTIKASIIKEMASSNTPVSRLADEDAIREKRDCMAYYGAMYGQAYMYLNSDLSTLKAVLLKGKKGTVRAANMGKVKTSKAGVSTAGLSPADSNKDKAAVSVTFVGYDDFVLLAEAALVRAVRDGIKSQQIKRIYDRVVNDNTPIRFDNSPTTLLSGSSQITLSGKPSLVTGGITMYGGAFAGFQGSYKLSRGWSYSSMVDQLRSTSTFSKYADDVAKYTDDAASNGEGIKAVISKKNAIDQARSTKTGTSLGGFLPGLHN